MADPASVTIALGDLTERVVLMLNGPESSLPSAPAALHRLAPGVLAARVAVLRASPSAAGADRLGLAAPITGVYGLWRSTRADQITPPLGEPGAHVRAVLRVGSREASAALTAVSVGDLNNQARRGRLAAFGAEACHPAGSRRDEDAEARSTSLRSRGPALQLQPTAATACPLPAACPAIRLLADLTRSRLPSWLTSGGHESLSTFVGAALTVRGGDEGGPAPRAGRRHTGRAALSSARVAHRLTRRQAALAAPDQLAAVAGAGNITDSWHRRSPGNGEPRVREGSGFSSRR